MITFTTPVGRLVQGSLYKAQDKDQAGRPLTVKSGPNVGQPQVKWFFAIAIRKDDQGWPAFYQELYNEARMSFPRLFDPTTGHCTHPGFAWKIIDGDSTQPNQNNKIPTEQPGFAGCWVVRFSSGFAPRCFDLERKELPEGAIKAGYYIRVSGSASGNQDNQKPGMYMNHSLVQLVGYGPEIAQGVDPDAAFADNVALPPGASAVPVAPPAAAMAPPAAAMAPPAAAPAYDFALAKPEASYMVNGAIYTETALRQAGYIDAHFATLQKVG